MRSLAENLARIREAIAAACRRSGRSPEEIELMAVSKTYPPEVIAEAASLGLTLFGENRVQEFAAKSAMVRAYPVPLRVHLIGHLQSNKASRAAGLFDSVDSVDSLRLAERLNEASGGTGRRLPVLIEVKLSSEPSKEGLDPGSAEAAELLERLPDLSHLEVRGLMTIAPLNVPAEETRACFGRLRGWRDRWAGSYPRLDLAVLSMGMSGDFPLAIEEGATRVRIGTALFGRRTPSPREALEEGAPDGDPE